MKREEEKTFFLARKTVFYPRIVFIVELNMALQRRLAKEQRWKSKVGPNRFKLELLFPAMKKKRKNVKFAEVFA